MLQSDPMYTSAPRVSRNTASLSQDSMASAPTPPNFILTAPAHTSHPGVIISNPAPTDATTISIAYQGNATASLPMLSTNQGLRPIPPAATQIGDPNGHHEITEPDFTATRPCRGCAPVIEITATGWVDATVEEQHGSTGKLDPAPLATQARPMATISAGAATIIVGEGPDGDTFVIADSYTVFPDQTVVVDNTPIQVRTSDGKTEMVLGTKVIPLHPDRPEMTSAPVPLPGAVPPVLSIGTATIMPNPQSQYVLGVQTLVPGGEPLTISGTILSLAPSATALVINGVTSSIVPAVGGMYTAVMPGALTLEGQIYTANGAGDIIMGPGTTLIPGGNPVTINGTTLSLVSGGSAVAVQGKTSTLQPATTVVTLTKDPTALKTGSRSVEGPRHSAEVYIHPTAGTESAGATWRLPLTCETRVESVVLLLLWGIHYVGLRL